MANKFASMPVPVQSHGNFEFNSMHTTTGDFGRLSVLKCIECVLGDTINFNMDIFIRAAISQGITYGFAKSFTFGIMATF